MPRRQELLLRAAWLPGEEAAAAWRAWKQGVDWARLDDNTQALLPLLWKNLARDGVSDPLLERLRKTYRYNSLRNQGLRRDLARVLAILGRRGIPVMVLKGMALTLWCYEDPGVRPMHDIDLLIKPGDAGQAVAALAAEGWPPAPASPRPFGPALVATGNEYALRNRFGTQIDLHWRTRLHAGPGEDEPYWAGAVELSLGDARPLAMNPTDMLRYTLEHGLKHLGANAPRMLADMHAILVKAGPEMQWVRLADGLERGRMTLPARAILTYMKSLLGTPIPRDALRRLGAVGVTGRERLAYLAMNRMPAGALLALMRLTRVAADYRWAKEVLPGQGAAMSMAVYLKNRWGLSRVGKVPHAFMAKAVRHLGPGPRT